MNKQTDVLTEAVPGETGFQITIETNSPDDLPRNEQPTINSNGRSIGEDRAEASTISKYLPLHEGSSLISESVRTMRPMKTTYGFSRRGPDHVAQELATVLSRKTWLEFKALFEIVHANLKARNAASGGEEMLRLRAYEKLQNLVSAGIVEKSSKKYRGVGPALAVFFETAAGLNTKFAEGTHSRPPKASATAAA